MSAYDRSVGDSIYGKGDRYVSRKRLEAVRSFPPSRRREMATRLEG
jgi:hypothetical protein